MLTDVASQIDSTFANSDHQTWTEAENGFYGSLFTMFGSIFAMARMLGVMVVIAICLVAANTAAMSIRERGAEVALMRALGFSGRLILICLLSESTLLAFAGGILGCVSAIFLMHGRVPQLPGLSQPLPFSPGIVVAGLALSVIVGIVSAVIPASSAVRRNIVTGLRHVG